MTVAFGVLAKKGIMSQVFGKEGRRFGVTVLHVLKNVIKALRREAYQLESSTPKKKFLKEFRTSSLSVEVGDSLGATMFLEGEKVDVSGVSKGKGFAGVMKRWGHRGMRKTHGTSVSHRAPGSVGQHTFPAKVWKNKKLPGQMGNRYVSVQNLTVVRVLPEKNILLVEGSVPGPRGGVIEVKKAVKAKGKIPWEKVSKGKVTSNE